MQNAIIRLQQHRSSRIVITNIASSIESGSTGSGEGGSDTGVGVIDGGVGVGVGGAGVGVGGAGVGVGVIGGRIPHSSPRQT